MFVTNASRMPTLAGGSQCRAACGHGIGTDVDDTVQVEQRDVEAQWAGASSARKQGRGSYGASFHCEHSRSTIAGRDRCPACRCRTAAGRAVLQPFRALRPRADGAELAALLCPPYDVIDAAQRAELLARDPDNAVAVILPEPADDPGRYEAAAQRLQRWVDTGHYRVDDAPALYVYEMPDASGATTRGLVGAVELRDPADGVILPHENTMAGPVARPPGADVGHRGERRADLPRLRRRRRGLDRGRHGRRRRAACPARPRRTASRTACGRSPIRRCTPPSRQIWPPAAR